MPVFIIPFTPKLAIALIPPEYPRQHELFTIDKTEDIKFINYQIISNEYVYNGDFVISNDKNELERLRSLLINEKDDLDKLRNSI